MKSVSSRRSRYIHATADDNCRKTICGRKCDGWAVEPDVKPTCPVCYAATTYN